MAITTYWRCFARRCASRISTIRSTVGQPPYDYPGQDHAAAGVGGLEVGGPADLLIFEGRDWLEVLFGAGNRADRAARGPAIDTALPAYDELDHLCGAC